MKTGLFLSFLLSACLLSGVQSQCNLTNGTFGVQFPDIVKYTADSYIMKVEYSVRDARQTDFYTEFYEYEFKRGRLDGHQGGKKFQYIYRAESYEAWNIGVNKCELVNITVTPEFMRDDMTDWVHSSGTPQFTTIGPSAMLKVAYDEWKKQNPVARSMAYMGKAKGLIRGESAVFFRRCLSKTSHVDYFFAAEEEENAFDDDAFKKNVTPLRVAFFNMTGKEKEMATQFYDIISFRHKIPKEFDPFQLPKGQNCQRGGLLVNDPKMPDFSSNSLMVQAEVLYRKISTEDNANELMSSYYSTLMFALDREINHVAYKYSSWNTTKPDKKHQEPFLNFPEYIVYDMTHKYTYKLNYGTGKCSISRDEKFSPSYRLPENGGSISLTDPYLLFPNNEFTFLSKGKERGLIVNIYEAYVEKYVLDAETMVEKMYASRSYFTDNEEMENAAAVRNPLAQVELHLFRKDNIEEILTFNFFGFTTKLPKKWNLFDITNCFRNEDDYLYLTLGFEPDLKYLPELERKLPEVEDNVLRQITMKSELNAVRIPYVMTDMNNNFIIITMLILGKPPLILDFKTAESDKTIVATEGDVQGVSTFDVCANNCLETKSGCWGFSLCGSTCYYGTSENTKVEDKKGCLLYKRYTNGTYIQSKEVQANNIVGQVVAGELTTMIILDSGDKVELKATVAHITDPAEDDELFEKMGNMLNPRMRVLKASYKLKKASLIKNLGKLRYDECQRLCLDFKDCETISYCLINSECSISNKLGVDLKDEEFEENNLCTVLTRKYADHFDRTPGVFASQTGGTKAEAKSVEDCARECLKQTKFKCKSFDHCAGGDREGCYLYDVHYLHSGAGKPADGKSPRCGHYSRKYSVEFKKKDEAQVVGGNFQIILNITLEECAQRCIEFGGGACYGYNYCQDQEMSATSCTLIDSDPSRLKYAYNPICSNYGRTAPQYAPLPYTTGYAGGIGFLCFLVGGIIGAIIVFAIAYIRVNRQR